MGRPWYKKLAEDGWDAIQGSVMAPIDLVSDVASGESPGTIVNNLVDNVTPDEHLAATYNAMETVGEGAVEMAEDVGENIVDAAEWVYDQFGNLVPKMPGAGSGPAGGAPQQGGGGAGGGGAPSPYGGISAGYQAYGQNMTNAGITQLPGSLTTDIASMGGAAPGAGTYDYGIGYSNPPTAQAPPSYPQKPPAYPQQAPPAQPQQPTAPRPPPPPPPPRAAVPQRNPEAPPQRTEGLTGGAFSPNLIGGDLASRIGAKATQRAGALPEVGGSRHAPGGVYNPNPPPGPPPSPGAPPPPSGPSRHAPGGFYNNPPPGAPQAGQPPRAPTTQDVTFLQGQDALKEQKTTLGDVRGFYNQGPGPSAAQAQLAQGADMAMRQQLSLAKSGRGGGTSTEALRNAQGYNVDTFQGANQDLALLRAKEYDDFQNRRLSAMGLASDIGQGAMDTSYNLFGDVRGQDIDKALGERGQDIEMGLGVAELGLGYGNLGAQYSGFEADAFSDDKNIAAGDRQRIDDWYLRQQENQTKHDLGVLGAQVGVLDAFGEMLPF